jgi:hypothetical protein
MPSSRPAAARAGRGSDAGLACGPSALSWSCSLRSPLGLADRGPPPGENEHGEAPGEAGLGGTVEVRQTRRPSRLGRIAALHARAADQHREREERCGRAQWREPLVPSASGRRRRPHAGGERPRSASHPSPRGCHAAAPRAHRPGPAASGARSRRCGLLPPASPYQARARSGGRRRGRPRSGCAQGTPGTSPRR